MTTAPDTQTLITGLRVTVAALIFGVVAFAGFAYFIAPVEGSSNQFMVSVAFVVAALTFALRPLVSQAILRRVRAQPPYGATVVPAAEIAEGFRQWSLVRAAMAEFPGMFACVAILLTGSTVTLAIVAAVLAVLAHEFPSNERFRRFEAAVGSQAAL